MTQQISSIMIDPDFVRQHYEAGLGGNHLPSLLKDKIAALGDGEEVERHIAAFDHFHVRGPAATAELAELATVKRGSHVLDAGCGLGGPSRFLAAERGCKVVGVDLSPAFVEVASWLAERAGIRSNLRYEVANISALPFPNETFDLVWSEHVMMNVHDRKGAYRELVRVLRPGGTLAFYEPVAQSGAAPPLYPMPWAETAAASHLLNREDIVAALDFAGLNVTEWRDVSNAATAAFASQTAPNPGMLGLTLAMGPRFPVMAMNFARNIMEGRIGLIMGTAQSQ